MPNVASHVSQLTGESTLVVFTRVKELEKEGWSIIHLELGEPDFHPATQNAGAHPKRAVALARCYPHENAARLYGDLKS